LEGKTAEKTSPRKSTSRTLKRVGQQNPGVFGTDTPAKQTGFEQYPLAFDTSQRLVSQGDIV
jgi:hypothetical protein